EPLLSLADTPCRSSGCVKWPDSADSQPDSSRRKTGAGGVRSNFLAAPITGERSWLVTRGTGRGATHLRYRCNDGNNRHWTLASVPAGRQPETNAPVRAG